MEGITINKESLKQLKERYNKAVQEGEESFFFQGKELVTGYAKYVIQYVESKIK